MAEEGEVVLSREILQIGCQGEVLSRASGEMLEADAQRACGRRVPGSVQGQVVWGPGQPGLVLGMMQMGLTHQFCSLEWSSVSPGRPMPASAWVAGGLPAGWGFGVWRLTLRRLCYLVYRWQHSRSVGGGLCRLAGLTLRCCCSHLLRFFVHWPALLSPLPEKLH